MIKKKWNVEISQLNIENSIQAIKKMKKKKIKLNTHINSESCHHNSKNKPKCIKPKESI